MVTSETDRKALGGRRLFGIRLRSRRGDTLVAVMIAIIGPVLAVATVGLLKVQEGDIGDFGWLPTLLVIDGLYALLLLGLIVARVFTLLAARRSAFAGGASLHLRFIGAFTLIAGTPAIAVTIFATATINFGFEAWFNERVARVISDSLQVADVYVAEHRLEMQEDALATARAIEQIAQAGGNDNAIGAVLRHESQVRGLTRSYVINRNREIALRGYNSFLFSYLAPDPATIRRASGGESIFLIDEERGELRAVLPLRQIPDRFLYAVRDANAVALRHASATRDTVALYLRLKDQSQQVLFSFGLFYAMFATFVVLSAIWFGLWLADRMSDPIGKLAEAAQRIGSGDLEVRVPPPDSKNEMAQLIGMFNHMVTQVREQRDELIEARHTEEIRRIFTENVLSGVPVGVIGIDADGTVDVVNRAAGQILEHGPGGMTGIPIQDAFPEVTPALDEAREQSAAIGPQSGTVERNVAISSQGGIRELLVRISPEYLESDIRGYVITFDDLTELVTAQRQAAWGEIARRVAHEIKNPLTPIQLAAERLRDRVPAETDEARALLDRYTGLITRQVSDINLLVDEFSRFARMPTPHHRPENLRELLDDCILLERTANEDIQYMLDAPEEQKADCDRTLLSQAVANLLKNAVHAVRARQEKETTAGEDPTPGQIQIRLRAVDEAAEIEVEDTGIGFPAMNRNSLLEPYRSDRADGVGLGLAIVRRAIESHGGSIQLLDAREGTGARVRLRLPLTFSHVAPVVA